MRKQLSLSGAFLIFLGLISSAMWTATAQAAPGGVDDGLRVWLQATSGISVSDGEPVLTWADGSGHGNNASFNSANLFGELPPDYVASNPAANNMPTVRFSGINALELDLTWLAGSDYTIFVVNSRDRFGLANFYLAGDSAVQDRNLTLGYENESLLRQAHFARDLDAAVEPYLGQPIWALDTFRFSTIDGKDIYQDAELVATDDVLQALVSNTGTTLGHFRAFGPFYWFQGDLAEVVVYDRTLDANERLQVEADLAGRYGRPLSVSSYVPCDAEWQSRGQYLVSLIRTTIVFYREGLITPRQLFSTIRTGFRSDCGRQ